MEVLSGSESESRKEDGANVESQTEVEAGEKAEVSEKKVVSRRPAKRTRRTPAKRSARTRKAAGEAEAEAKAPEAAGEKEAEVSEKKVVSRRPAKRTRRTPAKRTARTRKAAGEAEAEAKAPEAAEAVVPEAEPQPEAGTEAEPSQVEAAEEAAQTSRWGRRRRSATETAGAEQEAPSKAEPESEAPEPEKAPAPEPSGGEPSQDARRSRRRRTRRRRSNVRDSAEGDARQESRGRTPPPASSQTVAEILAEPWTEDKARKFLSEGFLTALAAPLVSDRPVDSIDAEALAERLRVIRKVLADECMVEDDATDVMLLDMVMNALADRIEVYRLEAQNGDLENVEQVLEVRYKADRRLIETVAALKNA